jgi:hypothetical protein
VAEFDVDDIDDAQGVRRYATPQAIKAAGDEGKPYDSYEIQFADGVFAYRITFFGPPGSVSEEQAKEIAKSVYDRVKGAPAQS